jgi:hypothetical protein
MLIRVLNLNWLTLSLYIIGVQIKVVLTLTLNDFQVPYKYVGLNLFGVTFEPIPVGRHNPTGWNSARAYILYDIKKVPKKFPKKVPKIFDFTLPD